MPVEFPALNGDLGEVNFGGMMSYEQTATSAWVSHPPSPVTGHSISALLLREGQTSIENAACSRASWLSRTKRTNRFFCTVFGSFIGRPPLVMLESSFRVSNNRDYH